MYISRSLIFLLIFSLSISIAAFAEAKSSFECPTDMKSSSIKTGTRYLRRSSPDGDFFKDLVFPLKYEDVKKTPEWDWSTGVIPVSPNEAIDLSRQAFEANIKAPEEWKLYNLSLEKIIDNHWIWIATWHQSCISNNQVDVCKDMGVIKSLYYKTFCGIDCFTNIVNTLEIAVLMDRTTRIPSEPLPPDNN